jgi:PPK2 family polyphosphate:nucleotide phosphotransferase
MMKGIDWKRYQLKSKTTVDLQAWDPQETKAWEGDKKAAGEQTLKLNKELEALQELLYAEGKHKVLIVLQGMDTSGKDGVMRRVFDGVNPQGVRVASFKAPTPPELAHDYLWRIHQQTPGRGEMVVFNRSHYEDVLVVRVHQLASPKVWGRRYNQINAFERLLVEEGTTILKFFLHISLEEQAERLLERIEMPEKQWKFNPGDLDERKLWADYQQAYTDVLSRTSTPWAPWIVVPANRNWYRDLIISAALVDTLKGLKMKFPSPPEDLEQYRAALES